LTSSTQTQRELDSAPRWTCWLDEAGGATRALVGGKAASLARLAGMGLPVPRGFVVTVGAYRAALRAAGLGGLPAEELRERILAAPVPAEVAAAILGARERLEAAVVAVRSSATAEDLASASFAGQYETFLNVAGEDALLDAVRACWASGWSPRALSYRRRRGGANRELALAVVVQEMVAAECAGVLFTADPVTGERERMTVEAVRGLGDALVSGRAADGRYATEPGGWRLIEGERLLPDTALAELAELGGRVEAAFGRPQDIEWAYAEGRCVLLQARPITSIGDREDLRTKRPGSAPRRYTRLQRAGALDAVEHAPLPPYPFDVSVFFRPLMRRAVPALRSLGLATLAPEEVLVEPADGVVQFVPPVRRPTPRALVALPAALARSLRATPEAWLERSRASLTPLATRIDAEDLQALTEDELLARIEALRDTQIELTMQRFAPFPRGLLARQALGLLLRLAVGRGAHALQTELLAEVPCVSTEIDRELARLSAWIVASDALTDAFSASELDGVEARLERSDAGRALLADLRSFLERYGARETGMAGAARPAWRDDPLVVYGLLKSLVAEGAHDRPHPGHGDRSERARRALAARVSEGRLGLRRRLLLPRLLRLLEATRAFIAFREDSHFDLFAAFPVLRRVALELGRRLTRQGALAQARDVFLLELEEIAHRDSAAATRDLTAARKAARDALGARLPGVPAELLATSEGGGELRGAAASPGQATGRVRLVLDERDFARLRPGEVLVARYTSPAWTPLFLVAAAVVVDAGGSLSHTAIVAREYGRPAVMGTRDATRRLRDGQRVLVDGSAGRVTLIGDQPEGS
jgi:rifampicin phosphotransferase